MRPLMQGRIVGRTTRPVPSASSVPGTSAMAVKTRLRRSGDVRAVFSGGTVAHGHAMVVHCRARAGGGPARWTVVAGRKVGNAVARNRAKRRLRSVVRGAELPAAVDLAVVARAPAVLTRFGDLESEFAHLVRRATRRTEAMA